MTIKKRILLSSLVLLALFLIMSAVNWYGNRSVMNKTTTAYLLEKSRMHVQGIFRGVNEFIIDEGEPLSIELTHEHIDGFDQDFELVTEVTKDPDIKKVLNETIKPQWQIVKGGTLAFLKDNPWISVDDDKAMLQYGKLTTEAKKLYTKVETLATESKLIAESTAKKTQNTVNIVVFIILVIFAFLLYSLYRSITTPIMELNRLAEGFSNGDLNVVMDDSRKDEFGRVGSYLNMATSKLSKMISNVKELTNTLSINSDNLSSSATHIADNSSEQSSQTGRAASAMEEMSASFVDVAKNTQAAAESSREASNVAAKGGEVVKETITGMSKISQAVKESADTVEALGKRSEQIGEIIQVINDIAGQTNLLALNAAIEAARAGEQGRGFAVVADEVRKLAERTSNATTEISDMILGIQAETGKAVQSMHDGTKEVESGVALANEAGNALKQIVASVQNVTDMVQQVATAAQEQSTTGDVVSSNVESIARLTLNTADSAMESSESASMLNELAQELRQLVSIFNLRDGNNTEYESAPSTLLKEHQDELNNPGTV